MRISSEAIYQALYVQSRGALRRELTACLRTGRTLRVPRPRAGKGGKHFVTPEIMISERPAEASDRAVPGHWEGDLILGLGSSAIGTLVERTTRFTLLIHLPRMEGYGSEARIKNGPAFWRSSMTSRANAWLLWLTHRSRVRASLVNSIPLSPFAENRARWSAIMAPN